MKQSIWRPTLEVGHWPSYVGFNATVGRIGQLVMLIVWWKADRISMTAREAEIIPVAVICPLIMWTWWSNRLHLRIFKVDFVIKYNKFGKLQYKVDKYKGTTVQKYKNYKSTTVQNTKSTKIQKLQKYNSTKIQKRKKCKNVKAPKYKSTK